YRPGPYRRRLLQARETGRPGDRHRGTSRRAQKASRHYRRAFPGRRGPAVQAPACAPRDTLHMSPDIAASVRALLLTRAHADGEEFERMLVRDDVARRLRRDRQAPRGPGGGEG